MMKILKLLLFVFSIQFIIAQQKSTITDVTVYLDGAEIKRSAKVKLSSGTSEFIFKDLSPYIEESSIQVSGLKTTSVLSINYANNFLSEHKHNDSISHLQSELENLNSKIENQRNIIAGYNEELSLIKSNQHLGNETEVVSLEKLKAFASYYRTRTTELKIAINTANKAIKTYTEKHEAIKNQLAEFNVEKQIQTGEIKLKLNSEIPSNLDLKLSYNIKNAGWFPIYDLKAEKIDRPLNLEYKAHVFQNSGCDWSNVNLVLSTGDPNTNNEKPIVNPKYLNFISTYSNYKSHRATRSYNYKYNPLVKSVSGVITSESDGLPLPGVSVIEKGTTNGVQTDFDGKYTLKLTTGNTLVYSYVGMKTEELPIHSSTINLSLDSDNMLDEVVVIGYGTSSRRSFTTEKDRNKSEQLIEQYGDNNLSAINIEEGITNTRFEIDKKYSIPSDGDVTVIEVNSFKVPASYDYFAAPILNENVFLTAKIGNWEQYNLLPAEANVYFEGSYSGKTNINPSATTDSLTISLGVDPNIIVKRTQLKDFKKTTFIGSNKVVYKGFEIEVKNNKSTPINLWLFDRIPISQNRDIKIDDIETGSSNYNKEKGILKWQMNINSGQTDAVKHSYTIKYPKDKRVNL